LEGNFSQLLAKARFEDAKLHHLGCIHSQAKVYLPSTPTSVVNPENDASFRPQRSGVQFKTVLTVSVITVDHHPAMPLFY